MKNLIIFLLFSLTSFETFGQVVAVQNDRFNVLYCSMDNPVTIAQRLQSRLVQQHTQPFRSTV